MNFKPFSILIVLLIATAVAGCIPKKTPSPSPLARKATRVATEMAKQLEQAKMQVKKDTPVFTINQPVTVPLKSSNSRAKTLIIWTFFGFVLGCVLVIGKQLRLKLKDRFKNANPEPDKTEPEPDQTGPEPEKTETKQ